MRSLEKAMPVAAAVTALSTLLCCLPLGLSAGVLAAGVGIALAPLRPWLLVLSTVFLAVGFVQLYRANRTCQRRSWGGILLFPIAAMVVVGMTLFPQVVAGFLADRLAGGAR